MTSNVCFLLFSLVRPTPDVLNGSTVDRIPESGGAVLRRTTRESMLMVKESMEYVRKLVLKVRGSTSAYSDLVKILAVLLRLKDSGD